MSEPACDWRDFSRRATGSALFRDGVGNRLTRPTFWSAPMVSTQPFGTALSGRRPTVLRATATVACSDGSRTISWRPHQAIAGHLHQRIVVYPIGPGAQPGPIADELDLPDDGSGRRVSTRGLEPAGGARDSARSFRPMALSVARHARIDRAHIRHLRISVGRSRSGSSLVVWPCDAARRRSPSDAADRRAGRFPGHHRRAGAYGVHCWRLPIRWKPCTATTTSAGQR